MVVVSSGCLPEVESRPSDSHCRFLHLLTYLSSLRAWLKTHPTRSLSLLSNTTERYILLSAHFSYLSPTISHHLLSIFQFTYPFSFTHLCYLRDNSSFFSYYFKFFSASSFSLTYSHLSYLLSIFSFCSVILLFISFSMSLLFQMVLRLYII